MVKMTSAHVFFLILSLQLIQTISAVDTDEPLVGHKFVFSISATNPNFTIADREGEKQIQRLLVYVKVCLEILK